MFAEWRDDIDVDLAHLSASLNGECILLTWSFDGDQPTSVRLLRDSEYNNPEPISGNLPGDATRYLDRGVEPGGSFRYWLEVVEADGTTGRFGPTEPITVPEETFELVLYAAYPSPSRDTINFVYSLPADGQVTLSVYDLSGRRVATLVDADETAGRHEASWNCTEVPSGVYLYSLETSAGSLTQRLVVSR
jgi:hypothetical protein